MRNLKISAITLILLLILLFIHLRGMYGNLYLYYWFYDIIAHFLGGVCIALSVYCVSILLDINWLKNRLWYMIILTLLAGIAWEIFEVYFNIAGHRFGTYLYYMDTIKDLIMDTLGGLFVWFIVNIKK